MRKLYVERDRIRTSFTIPQIKTRICSHVVIVTDDEFNGRYYSTVVEFLEACFSGATVAFIVLPAKGAHNLVVVEWSLSRLEHRICAVESHAVDLPKYELKQSRSDLSIWYLARIVEDASWA